MSMPEFERLLAALIPGRGRTAITLTEPPEDEAALLRLFDKALGAPLSLYPNLGDTFWHVPIEDSSADGVVRLVFEEATQQAA